jgi:dolichol-phosphate mannosyltransferase
MNAGTRDRVLIVVPTYNEKDNVSSVVTEFLAPVPEADLLFVDDNSPDGTGDLLYAIAGANSRVHVMHRAGKLGLGTAYVEGFQWGLARDYDYLLEMDADFSHDPKYLPEMVRRARDGADRVVGSRYAPGGGTVNWGAGRKFISRFGGLYARTVLGVKVRDMTAGFISYRRRTLEEISLDTVQSNGYSFQIEMKYRVLKAGMRVEEVPIVFADRRVGQSKMSRAIVAEALLVCWKLRLNS